MRNKPKNPLQKVDSNGCFQFDENQQFDGPDRITGIMSISAPGNIKDAINNLLIELKGDAHQIHYKPTKQKNLKLRRCSLAFQRVYAPMVSCIPFGMGSKM
jgi:hypothetical protein